MRVIPILGLAAGVLAFTPRYGEQKMSDWQHLLTLPVDTIILGSMFATPHVEMTGKGIESIYEEFFGISVPSTVMIAARKEIEDWSAKVDDSKEPRFQEKNVAVAHFDGEQFEGGQEHILELRQQCINSLKAGVASEARMYLGRLLHTLQDFYAHSNWVELGNDDISTEIGKVGGKVYPQNNLIRTCQDCVSVFNSPSDKTKYEENNKCLDQCKTDGFGPRQVFDSTDCVFARWTVFECHPFECTDNLYKGQSYITSGYYGGQAILKPNANKCSHGGVFDSNATGLEGINKDTLNPTFSPHYRHHPKAAALAIEASKVFLHNLGTPELTKAELRLLYGVGASSLTFVIDTTSSMQGVIDSAREAAIEMVRDRVGTDMAPDSYILVAFSDPADTTPPFQTSNADSFIEKLLTLQAVSSPTNFDCPEPSLHGINKALLVMPSGGNIFFFTDAAAQDPELAPLVTDVAKGKQVKVWSFLFPSSCDPSGGYDKSVYRTLSGSSGGQVYSVNAGDADKMVGIANTVLEPFSVQIFYGTYYSIFAFRKREVVQQKIPIDASITKITFAFSGKGTMRVTDPSGSLISASSPQTTLIDSDGVTLIIIAGPVSGIWTVEADVVSKEDSLSIYGAGSLPFLTFDFSELRGEKGHVGLFPIDRPVVSGETVSVVASVDHGGFKTAEFEFRSKDGNTVIQKVPLEQGDGVDHGIPSNMFIGKVQIPYKEFVIYVTGLDNNGAPYQRVIPGTFGSSTTPPPNNTTSSTIIPTSTSSPSNSYSPTSSLSTSRLWLNGTTSRSPCAACPGGHLSSSITTKPSPCTACPSHSTATTGIVTTVVSGIITVTTCPVTNTISSGGSTYLQTSYSLSTITIDTTYAVPVKSIVRYVSSSKALDEAVTPQSTPQGLVTATTSTITLTGEVPAATSKTVVPLVGTTTPVTNGTVDATATTTGVQFTGDAARAGSSLWVPASVLALLSAIYFSL